MNNKFINLVY